MMTLNQRHEFESSELTNYLDLGIERIEPGRKIKITERSQLRGNLWISLAFTETGAELQNLPIHSFFKLAESSYCILTPPAWIRDDLPTIPLMVLKVIDRDTLKTIGTDELDQVTAACTKALQTSSPPCTSDVFDALGTFPTVEI